MSARLIRTGLLLSLGLLLACSNKFIPYGQPEFEVKFLEGQWRLESRVENVKESGQEKALPREHKANDEGIVIINETPQIQLITFNKTQIQFKSFVKNETPETNCDTPGFTNFTARADYILFKVGDNDCKITISKLTKTKLITTELMTFIKVLDSEYTALSVKIDELKKDKSTNTSLPKGNFDAGNADASSSDSDPSLQEKKNLAEDNTDSEDNTKSDSSGTLSTATGSSKNSPSEDKKGRDQGAKLKTNPPNKKSTINNSNQTTAAKVQNTSGIEIKFAKENDQPITQIRLGISALECRLTPNQEQISILGSIAYDYDKKEILRNFGKEMDMTEVAKYYTFDALLPTTELQEVLTGGLKPVKVVIPESQRNSRLKFIISRPAAEQNLLLSSSLDPNKACSITLQCVKSAILASQKSCTRISASVLCNELDVQNNGYLLESGKIKAKVNPAGIISCDLQ